jgi:hypothetical protein
LERQLLGGLLIRNVFGRYRLYLLNIRFCRRRLRGESVRIHFPPSLCSLLLRLRGSHFAVFSRSRRQLRNLPNCFQLRAHRRDDLVGYSDDSSELAIGFLGRYSQQFGDQLALLFGGERGSVWASTRNAFTGIRIARRGRRRRELDGGLLLGRA